METSPGPLPKNHVMGSAQAQCIPPGPLSHFLTTPYDFYLPGFLLLTSLKKLGRYTKSPGQSQSEGALGAQRAVAQPTLLSTPQPCGTCTAIPSHIPSVLDSCQAAPSTWYPPTGFPLHQGFQTARLLLPGGSMLLQRATTSLLPRCTRDTGYLSKVKSPLVES